MSRSSCLEAYAYAGLVGPPSAARPAFDEAGVRALSTEFYVVNQLYTTDAYKRKGEALPGIYTVYKKKKKVWVF